jgi:tripartite-type tricarboxylate transporter receptor subunit TctC
VLVAGGAARATTISGLIAAAKATPAALTFGSTGVGTGTHIALEVFNRAAGIKAVHVPARQNQSIADVITSAVEGRIAYTMAPISFALPHINGGKILALGVSGTRRSPLLPAVPTISEAGVADYNFPIWYGVWAPVGTPAAMADKLAADFARALDHRDMTAWLATHGADRIQMTRTEFARFVLSETERAKQILGAAAR